MYLKFRAFRAINDLDSCLKFAQEHRNVLRDYGITNITTNTESWMYNPNIYCVVAESATDNKILGGVRVEISSENNFLPVELAVGKMDAAIYDIVKNFRHNGGIGELCALWNARAVAGIGLSMLLIRAGIAATSQLQVETLISICADYTLKMFQKVGFIVDHTLGLNGEFPYPNKKYTARVLGIMNAIKLDSTSEFDKERIESLRKNPQQSFTEQGTNREIHVDYNLVISK
ncbi:MAG: hypothetical protein V4635_16135 [Bacteroidota bacterium]